jgi:selenocysteine-specific elongation factor
MKAHSVVGMAGHIDHGKTALVKALTGTDTDRLKEEKSRGITTDLGFAFLNDNCTIIDVPGHEKFVRHMVAGVSTVDMVIFVVAADDGVMPQTREHLDILNLLGIRQGILAVNKVDAVEPELIDLVEEEIRDLVRGTFLETAPSIRVSGHTGAGVGALREAVLNQTAHLPVRPDSKIFRMCIDRAFSIKGVGTIAAGTILSGSVGENDFLDIQPAGIPTKVKQIHVHKHQVPRAGVGFRVACNLRNVEKNSLSRGDVLAEPGYVHSSFMLDARFTLLESYGKKLKNRTRIRLNIGTAEVMARIILLDTSLCEPGQEVFVQFRLEAPVAALRGDRFVVRSYSPVTTMGGGIILDSMPDKHKPFDTSACDRLQRLSKGDALTYVEEYYQKSLYTPRDAAECAQAVSLSVDECRACITSLEKEGCLYSVSKKKWVARSNLEIIQSKFEHFLQDYFIQNPYRETVSRARVMSGVGNGCDTLLSNAVFSILEQEGKISTHNDRLSASWHRVVLSSQEQKKENELYESIDSAGLTPLTTAELHRHLDDTGEKLLSHLMEGQKVIFVNDAYIYSKEKLMDAMKLICSQYTKKDDSLGMSYFRELFSGLSRKYVIPLLEYSDKCGFTRRVGDVRMRGNQKCPE